MDPSQTRPINAATENVRYLRRFASVWQARYAERVETKQEKRREGDLGTEDLAVLLEQVTRQDQTAFARLYDATAARIYGLALRITGRRDAAEEVASDAYMQIWQQASRYNPERGSPLAWMLTITRSRALDHLRRRDTAETHADPTVLQPELIAADNPVDLLAALDRATALHKAIAELPHTARQLIGLAFLRGLSHQEIATHPGMPLGTVKTILRTAMQTLRPRLAATLVGLEEIG